MRSDFDRRTPAEKFKDKRREGKVVKFKAPDKACFDGNKLDASMYDEAALVCHPKGGAELDRWFSERKREMTGRCLHCGGKTWTQQDDLRLEEYSDGLVFKSKGKFYKHCIAHILPKNIFKSVATHPLNWIELCFWNKSCHTNFDNHILDITELNCFDTVIERFVSMYPCIDKKERRRIPEVLMRYVNVDI